MDISPEPNATRQHEDLNGRHESRNFRFALANGIFTRIGFRFVNSNMILAAFVKELTNSNVMVGLTSSTMRAGWMWPQLLVSNLLEHRPRKMPYYIFGVSMRIAAWVLIPLLVFLMGDSNPHLLFLCFYSLYFVACSSMGISTIPYNDIVAKSIPARKRARFFGLRQIIGECFGIGAGFLIRYILSDRFSLSFPHNYAAMFVLAILMMVCASVCFAQINEPIHPVRDTRRSFWQHLKRGPHFLRVDRDYRYFMIFRVVLSFGGMCIPFYVPYALDRLVVTRATIGAFVAVGSASALLSNILWAYMGEKHGSRSLIVVTASLSCVAPVIAASVKYLPASFQTTFYFLVFIVNQAFMSGRIIAYMTYSLNLAPTMSRPTYLGFLNTITFPMSFVPILAGALLKIISYESMFVLSAAMSALAVFFAVRLSNVDGRHDGELNGSWRSGN